LTGSLASDLKHGSWGYDITHGTELDPKRPGRRRRRQFRKHGFPSKRAAQQALTKLRAKLDDGSYRKPSDKELGAYAQEVLRRRRANRALRESTLANYERYVRDDITPSKLGGMRLTEIRRTDVNGFLADLSDAGRGATTVRRILAVLQMVLSAAVRDELIGANPALGAERPAQPDATIKIWDLKTIGEFMRRASSHRLGALYELAIYCGLRRGELAPLRWQDVDLANRKLIVGRTRTTIDGKIVETMTPKTKSGHRTVPLTDAAVAALLTWKLRQDQEAEDAQEAWHTEGHVFTMEDGRALDPSYITRTFARICQQDEPLPELHFHGLRHTFASLAIARGSDLSSVGKLLGHSSVQVTGDIYHHLTAGVGQRLWTVPLYSLLTRCTHMRV
jgi:integrase